MENDPAVLRRLLTDTDTIAEVMGLAPSFSSGSGPVGPSGVVGVAGSIYV